MAPFVSVVMTIYNGQSYLLDSISSILGQSFNNFEFNKVTVELKKVELVLSSLKSRVYDYLTFSS